MIAFVPAMEEINAKAFAAWKAATLAVLGNDLGANLRFVGVETEIPAGDQFWGRVTPTIVASGRANLGALDLGFRRYRTNGILSIQLFAPKTDAENYWDLTEIADHLRGSYLGFQSASGIEYRNVRIDNTFRQEAQWLRQDLIAEFEFDEKRPNGV